MPCWDWIFHQGCIPCGSCRENSGGVWRSQQPTLKSVRGMPYRGDLSPLGVGFSPSRLFPCALEVCSSLSVSMSSFSYSSAISASVCVCHLLLLTCVLVAVLCPRLLVLFLCDLPTSVTLPCLPHSLLEPTFPLRLDSTSTASPSVLGVTCQCLGLHPLLTLKTSLPNSSVTGLSNS